MGFIQIIENFFNIGNIADDTRFDKELHRFQHRSREYQMWKDSRQYADLKKWFLSVFENYQTDKNNPDNAISFLCCSATKGFAWEYNSERWTLEEYSNFYHYIKEKIIALGYTKHTFDKKADETSVEYRVFLKPAESGNCQEKYSYGSILLCVTFNAPNSYCIKFSATSCKNNPECSCGNHFWDLLKGMFS